MIRPKPFQRREGGPYYVRITIDGRRVWRSLGTRDRSMAKELAEALSKVAKKRKTVFQKTSNASKKG
jgi:hypothetical protein